MIGAVLIVKSIVPLNPNSKLMCILYICLVTVVGAFAYAFTGVKTGLIKDVFKEDYLNKINSKLRKNNIFVTKINIQYKKLDVYNKNTTKRGGLEPF